jgi:hypothetical protein
MERAGDEQDLGAWSSRDAVEAWQRSSAARNATVAAATERMLDLAALRIEPVPAPRRHASVAEAIALQRDSRPLARVMAHLDDGARADAWTEIERAYRRFETPSGVTFPGEVLVGAATK